VRFWKTGLVDRAWQAARAKGREPFKINYGKEMEAELAALEQDILSNPKLAEKVTPRWLAVKALEGDEGVLKELEKYPGLEQVLARRGEAVKRLEGIGGEDIESLIAFGG